MWFDTPVLKETGGRLLPLPLTVTRLLCITCPRAEQPCTQRGPTVSGTYPHILPPWGSAVGTQGPGQQRFCPWDCQP